MRSSPGVSTLILVYVTVAKVRAIFIDADTKKKGVQLSDHELKQYVLLMTPPFFLQDITYLTRIQMLLKL